MSIQSSSFISLTHLSDLVILLMFSPLPPPLSGTFLRFQRFRGPGTGRRGEEEERRRGELPMKRHRKRRRRGGELASPRSARRREPRLPPPGSLSGCAYMSGSMTGGGCTTGGVGWACTGWGTSSPTHLIINLGRSLGLVALSWPRYAREEGKKEGGPLFSSL